MRRWPMVACATALAELSGYCYPIFVNYDAGTPRSDFSIGNADAEYPRSATHECTKHPWVAKKPAKHAFQYRFRPDSTGPGAQAQERVLLCGPAIAAAPKRNPRTALDSPKPPA